MKDLVRKVLSSAVYTEILIHTSIGSFAVPGSGRSLSYSSNLLEVSVFTRWQLRYRG